MEFKRLIPALAGLSLLSFSCDGLFTMQAPESISIKSSARYELAVGSIDYDVSNALSLSSIKKNIASKLGDNTSVFQYVPDESNDVLTYLVEYPLYTVSLDAGKYLSAASDSSDTSAATKGIEFSQDISLPEINFSEEESSSEFTVPDVGESITKDIESSFADIPSLPVSEQSATSGILKTISISSSSGITYDRLYYEKDSKVIVTVNKNSETSPGEGFKLELKIAILDSSGAELSSSGWADVTEGNNIVQEVLLDIDSGFPQDFKIQISYQTSSGTNDEVHTYSVKLAFDDNAKISKITGLYATSAQLGLSEDEMKVEHEEDFSSLVGLFKEAEIGEGNISIDADIPKVTVEGSSKPVWSGLSVIPEIKLSGCGLDPAVLLDYENTEGKMLDMEKNLSGIVLAPEDTDCVLKISGNYTLSLENATVYFVNGSSSQTVPIKLGGEIKKFSSVKIDLASEKYSAMQTSFELNKDTSRRISMGMAGYVKSIHYGEEKESGSGIYYKKTGDTSYGDVCKGLGVECTVINSLPEGNDIPVHLSSNIFNLSASDGNQVDGKISAKGNTESSSELWSGHPLVDLTGDLSDNTKDGTVYADFLFRIFDEGSSEWNLVNLEAGKTYTLALSDFEIIQDWDYMVVNLDSVESFQGTKSFNSVSLDSILGAFPISSDDKKEIFIDSIPVYMYARKPSSVISSSFDDLSLSGTMKYTWTDSQGNTAQTFITNTDGSDTEISFTDKIVWPENGNKISSILNNENANMLPDLDELNKRRENGEKISEVSLWTDMAEPMNDRASDIALEYDLNFKGGSSEDIIIYSKTVEDAQSSSDTNLEIAIDLVFVFPLSFYADKQIEVHFIELLNSAYNEDDSDLLMRSSAEDYEKYVKYADSIKNMVFEYNVRNYLLPYTETSFVLDSGESETSDGETVKIFDNQELGFNIGSNSAVFTKEQIKQTMTSYPFHPNFNLTFGNEETSETNPALLVISRDAVEKSAGYGTKAMGIDLVLAVKMDPDSPLQIWTSQKEEEQ